MTSEQAAPRSLTDLLDTLDPDNPATGVEERKHDAHDGLTIQDMLDRVGVRSFGAALLVPSLILVSPLSIIPLMPTIGGLVILTISIQAFFGRSHLWLPRFLASRRLTGPQLKRAVTYLRKPAAWLDRKSRHRLRFLSRPPMDRIALLSVMVVAATWPFLEILPMFTSVSAGGIALVAFALMVRDGFVLIAGYIVLGFSLAVVAALLIGIF
ncbi:exopolysaccharide biosynthesis protein [Marivita sp. XM-24bin2]|uniref:exopolysaccharide biosynthesis protein n=1 Tax=unclassified Marivita TaxID=2632480 RepID=UPI000D78D259|nr:exopolysaccharide biosynthesis protein [Marivita sp. XM-24bin2]MCR9107673.1 exopolysaccharide biosynthesis protein [Paracoccaceae bacterium]PWL35522.1 MAG: exopolysaccharide biosynthesis protein exod [Marivita sp. XM-24bin2]